MTDFAAHLPPWLEAEIRAHHLSIVDWDLSEGEASGPCDVLIASNIPRDSEAPWLTLRKLGLHAARHLVVLLPFREWGMPESPNAFDESTIGTQIEPDFVLSSSHVIRSGPTPRILLVYSRAPYLPQSGAIFGESALVVSPPASPPNPVEAAPSAAPEQWAARESELLSEIAELRARQANLQQEQDAREVALAAREAALQAQVRHWQARAADLTAHLEEQRRQHLESARQFRTAEEHAAREIETLHSRVAASAYEAANLRRLTNDLLTSRSWKITAPLRFLSKPLFTPPPEAEPAALSQPAAPPAHPSTGPASTPDPLESLWSELSRAPSLVVIPCAVPFRSTFAQRPISCARYLADRGSTVLFVSWQKSPGAETLSEGQEVYPRIFHLSLAAFQANLERVANSWPRERSDVPLTPNPQPLFFSSLPTPALLEAVRPLRTGGFHIHYDIMDDWEEFHRCGEAPWYTASAEREMVMLADTVSVVSEQLAIKFARLRKDIVEVRNGYDPAALGCRQFAVARTPLERPKVVGYFGHLSDAWFDWESVFEAARKLPEVEWELIGYDLSDRTRARLTGFANIRFSGLVAQSDLYRHAQRWWAGLIPFRAGALSAAVDPLKIYEYLHFGLPTVVTGVSGIAGYPLVRFAADRAGFLSAIGEIDRRPSEQSLAEVADFLRDCTWEARLAKLTVLAAQWSDVSSLRAQ